MRYWQRAKIKFARITVGNLTLWNLKLKTAALRECFNMTLRRDDDDDDDVQNSSSNQIIHLFLLLSSRGFLLLATEVHSTSLCPRTLQVEFLIKRHSVVLHNIIPPHITQCFTRHNTIKTQNEMRNFSENSFSSFLFLSQNPYTTSKKS